MESGCHRRRAQARTVREECDDVWNRRQQTARTSRRSSDIQLPDRLWLTVGIAFSWVIIDSKFLPDEKRPRGLPWGSIGDNANGVSESWGTLRFGRLAEILLYDTHLVHAPSNPFGWTAGKWMEWYPDVLGAAGKLTTAEPKPSWQTGWLRQHDRPLAAIAAREGRISLAISGDLHAVAIGKIRRAGKLNLEKNPITAVLAGPIGIGSSQWPSAFRGIGSAPPAYLDVAEEVKPIEQHSFTIADFLSDRIQLRLFKWDVKTQSPEVIDSLEPFHTAELGRPA